MWSVTYSEGGRSWQNFPDFIIAARESDGCEVMWLAETKGEMRLNTPRRSFVKYRTTSWAPSRKSAKRFSRFVWQGPCSYGIVCLRQADRSTRTFGATRSPATQARPESAPLRLRPC